ncbi:uroporphyrinogen-III synthase [Paludibacter propionicigenes WB4]|uniref:Uroporphyrinogen-III synthase n=1 Tax=Paludibacter propionicigenes (strain DSM 17365 / JCM 13257 / WB4) TaxID=694427 RepID=E4T6H6_PALPW|nr:uroporphyrinogen-III synthase [Paludibacter propionicigenes]ADQ80320.1 uroporphyrinogen-III synthase [Paludibacter propionicigenes WB4]
MKIKRILVSQPRPTTEKSPYFDISEKYSVKIDFRPFIKVEPILAKEFRTQRITILDYTAIIFNARHGIDHFFRLCEEMRITIPETMKYFCVSESVALYLQRYIHYRKRKVFYGATGKLAELVTIMNKHTDEKYLLITSDVQNEDTIATLEKLKVTYAKAVMYKTVSNDFGPDEEFNYDMLLFFSPIGIASLLKNFPNFEQGEIQIGCFGATTAQAVRDAGLRLDIEVPLPGVPSMTMALDNFLKENNKKTRK